MSGSIYGAPLAGNNVDMFGQLQSYNNALKTAAETTTEQQRPAFVQAQTTGELLKNELAKIQLGIKQYGLNSLNNPGDPNAQVPGTAAGGTAGSEGSSYGNQPGVALGMRQNNPGNLTFAGQPYAKPGDGNRFATFPDMATGVAATADQLALNQTSHGLNTVRGQVTRWVSDPKADLTTYIGDIAKALGVSPDAPLDFTDPRVQAAFIQAQQPHESAGGGATLNPADVQKGVQMAAARRGQQVQPTPTTAVAGTTATTPPPPAQTPAQSPSAPTTAQATPQTPPITLAATEAQPVQGTTTGFQPPQPNALAAAGSPSSPATSANGVINPNFGVAMPRYVVANAIGSNDPAKAMADAVQQRRNIIANTAASATDMQSWNAGVSDLWRAGWISTPQAQQYMNHYSPEFKNAIIQSMGSPESQIAANMGALDKGGVLTPEGFKLSPGAYAATHPYVEKTIKLADGTYQKVMVPAIETATAAGAQVQGQPGAPSGPAAAPPTGAAGGGPAAAPPPPAPPPGATGGAAGAAGVPGQAGSPSGEPVLPPGGYIAGKPELTPAQTADLQVQTAARTATVEAQAREQQATAQAYGDQAGQVVKAAQASPVTLERLGALEAAANDFRTGASGPTRAAAYGRLVDTMGALHIPIPDWLTQQAAAPEVINKLGGFLAANMVHIMGERAASVFTSVKSIFPNIEASTGGFQAVVSSIRQDALRDRDLGAFQEQWLAEPSHNKSISGMMTEFNKLHSPESYGSRVVHYPAPTNGKDMKENVYYKAKDGTVGIKLNGVVHIVPAGTADDTGA